MVKKKLSENNIRIPYDPEKAAQVIDWMAEGYTITACAGKLKVSRQTLYDWENSIPEFKEALDAGRAARQCFWENNLINTKAAARVTASIFALKNANPKEWADKKQVESTGKDGGPIEINNTQTIDLESLSLDELQALKTIIQKQKEKAPEGA